MPKPLAAGEFALTSTLALSIVVGFGIIWIVFGWYLGRSNTLLPRLQWPLG